MNPGLPLPPVHRGEEHVPINISVHVRYVHTPALVQRRCVYLPAADHKHLGLHTQRGNRLLEIAQLVYQSELERIGTGPDSSLGHIVDMNDV